MKILKDVDAKKQYNEQEVSNSVASIIAQVKENQDQAIIDLTEKYDRVKINNYFIKKNRLKEAYKEVSDELITSLKIAAERIEFFARKQITCLQPLDSENGEGITLGHKLIPISSCGAYIPGGRYPLPSTALMSIIPAKVAGVKRIAACSPPDRKTGEIHPSVLVGMDIAGADEVYCMGGAQAIAAYTYGTETVDPVNIIVGPGNKYVTEAKRQVSGTVGIDMLAGPSEVLIIADDSASPRYIAVDLLAKCEHDPDSIAILVTDSREIAEKVVVELEKELKTLETAELARGTWEANGKIILADNMEEAIKISDEVGPEHLQIMTRNNDNIFAELQNYGSLFIGDNAPVAFGDYISGTNHTLPTRGGAKFSNGVWVGTFIKVSSFQKISKEGAQLLIDDCARLAGTEGLFAHKRSAEIRKK